jgi:threonine/homoserine/homoserine lactone efflux protein
MIALFIRSLLIGIAVAMPVGPIGVLCIDHSVRGGIRMGLAAGVGAAFADAIFGFISGFGSCTYLTCFNDFWQLRLAAALLIFYIGIKNLRTTPFQQHPTPSGTQLGRAAATTFFLTISNPATLLSFAAVFLVLGVVSDEAPFMTASLLSAGIFIGSTLWWLFLCFLANHIQKRFNFKLSILSKISGVLMVTFAVYLLLSFIPVVPTPF